MKASESMLERLNYAIGALPTALYDANSKEQFDRNLGLVSDLRNAYERLLEVERKCSAPQQFDTIKG